MIRIAAKQDGFRRAGMAHTKEPKEYPDDKFTRDQLVALKAEPMLIVEQIDVKESKAPAGKPAEEKKKK